MQTFSGSLINLTALVLQLRDCSCYVSRRLLAPPPLWLQKHTSIFAQDLGHSPDLWHKPRLVNVTCPWSWRLCGITPAIASLIRLTHLRTGLIPTVALPYTLNKRSKMQVRFSQSATATVDGVRLKSTRPLAAMMTSQRNNIKARSPLFWREGVLT